MSNGWQLSDKLDKMLRDPTCQTTVLYSGCALWRESNLSHGQTDTGHAPGALSFSARLYPPKREDKLYEQAHQRTQHAPAQHPSPAQLQRLELVTCAPLQNPEQTQVPKVSWGVSCWSGTGYELHMNLDKQILVR